MEKSNKNQITLDDVTYNYEDLKPDQQIIVNHLADLDRKIASTQFNITQMQVGKQAFVDMLKASLAEVPKVEAV